MNGWLFIVGGVMVAGTGALGWTGSLGRNRLFGIRTRTTMASDLHWRAAHAAGGPWLTAGGLCWIGVGIAQLAERTALWIPGLLSGLALVCVGGVYGQRAARRLT